MVVPFFISELCKLFKDKRFIKISDDGQRTTLLFSRTGDIRTAQTHVPTVNPPSSYGFATPMDIAPGETISVCGLEPISDRSMAMLGVNNVSICVRSNCEARYLWTDHHGRAWEVCKHGSIL